MSTATRPAPRTAPSRRRRAPRRRGGALRVLVGLLVVAGVIAGGAWAALKQLGPQPTVVLVERCTASAALTGSGAASTDHDLSPDQAGNAALISAVSLRRGLPARAATIAIATATQESKLRNIDYGDRDSLGLFQQRPSQGWGTAAQVQDPVYATNAFLTSLVKIDDYGTLPIGEVAQRVQRSAYPLAYADHEAASRAWASALAGYSPAAVTCRLHPVTGSGAVAQAAAGSGYWPRTQAVLDQLGTERGPVTAVAADSGAGARLGAAAGSAPDADAVRDGWSLAAWSVAHAKELDVVAVGTDGRIWRRDAPDAGWTTLPASESATWAPAGAAVVVVAGGTLP